VFYSASAIWYATHWEGALKKRRSAQSLRVCSQGSCRPHTAIWPHGCLQNCHARHAHRRNCAYPALVVATPVPVHPTKVYQLSRHAQRPHTRPTCKRDQLRALICRWFDLPYVLNFFSFSFIFLFVLLVFICWVGLGRIDVRLERRQAI
jgi:hypothetical protein